MKLRARASQVPIVTAGVILAAMVVFGAARYSHFADVSGVASTLGDESFLGIAAVGALLVIVTGGIDLSVGSVVAFSGILAARLIESGWHPAWAGCAAVAFGAASGAAMGGIIHVFELPAFLVTLAGMFAVRAMAFVVRSESLAVRHPAVDALQRWGLPIGGGEQLSALACAFVVVACGAWVVLNRTAMGRQFLALGGSERAARSMGVPMARTRVTAYALAGVCSALAGCAAALYKQAGNPASATGLELEVIAAVVIGGTSLSGGAGSVVGTVIGVLILATIRRLIEFDGTLNSAWTSIAIGLMLLLFVGLQRLVGHLARRWVGRESFVP